MGHTRLKTFLALIILAALIFAGVKIIPVYVNAYEFQDSMRVEASVFPSAYPQKTPEKVREDLYKKAVNLQLPLSKEQISVSSSPGGISIAARFSVPVDLIVTKHTFDFNFSTSTEQTH